jgi:hypothetical protein
MKVYAITYYTGDADVTFKVYKKKSTALRVLNVMNLMEPATQHSGGDFYNLVEWEVE